jgi:MFS family permease
VGGRVGYNVHQERLLLDKSCLEWAPCFLERSFSSHTLTPPLARQLSRVLGRAVTSVLLDAVGTACLFGLSVVGPVWLDVPLYLLRTAAMNASYPAQRAILMDVVPKSQRGFWSSLENVTAFTWTGSAALGGWIVDRYDYRAT